MVTGIVITTYANPLDTLVNSIELSAYILGVQSLLAKVMSNILVTKK